jgi:uncharacterized radical SAM superfamily Fe-S cluster-containing enzyme
MEGFYKSAELKYQAVKDIINAYNHQKIECTLWNACSNVDISTVERYFIVVTKACDMNIKVCGTRASGAKQEITLSQTTDSNQNSCELLKCISLSTGDEK